MTKQKKSFLDKIMGGDENRDEQIVQTGNGQNSGQSGIDVGNEEDVLSKEIEKEVRAEDQGSGEGRGEVGVMAENNAKKDWFKGNEAGSGEEEGQLTIDVYQTKDMIVIKSIIGGARPEDLDISVTNDMVTIKGTRKNPDEVSAEDYFYQECFWGNFSRSIILPCDIKGDEVEAKMKNGILTVKLPKITKNSSMKVQVSEE